MSRNIVLAISRLFSSRVYKAGRFFTHSEREQFSRESRVHKMALLCGDCCDSNQVIILVA